MTRAEVIQQAAGLVREAGGQVKAAQRLGVSQAAVSKALRADDTSMDGLRKKILSEFGGIEVAAETYFLTVEPAPKRRGGKKK